MQSPAEPPPLAYARLSPETVLDVLVAASLRGDGRILQLNSFENRVYQVHLEDARIVVAKFYRPARWTDAQILEEHAFAQELVAAEVPVAQPLTLGPATTADLALLGEPPTLARHTTTTYEYRFGATARVGGRTPELDQPETLRRIGRFIGRLHTVGARKRFEHRATLDVKTFGEDARDAVLASGQIDDEQSRSWTVTCDAALALVRGAFAQHRLVALRLHGDCHRGNLLWNETGPHFVDLDDACNGPAMQDLWMLLDGDRHAMRWQLAELVAGYEELRDFDWRETRLIEALRTLRMIHHSAWLARRWHDPAFPIAFPWFGSASYWSQQVADLRDQIDAMREAAPLG
jgi:Ser/Thr protein kinase RdoA (MazF antagonist)